MPQPRGMFAPSDRALAFGAQYGEVLAKWGELFEAASALVAANVELGKQANDAAKEFDQWLKQTANAPWNWLNPEMMQQFMGRSAPRRGNQAVESFSGSVGPTQGH